MYEILVSWERVSVKCSEQNKLPPRERVQPVREQVKQEETLTSIENGRYFNLTRKFLSQHPNVHRDEFQCRAFLRFPMANAIYMEMWPKRSAEVALDSPWGALGVAEHMWHLYAPEIHVHIFNLTVNFHEDFLGKLTAEPVHTELFSLPHHSRFRSFAF